MTKSLMFSIIKTRPDIALTIFIINHYAKNFSFQYIKTMKIIMRYLKTMRILGITYGGEEKDGLIIKSYSDLD